MTTGSTADILVVDDDDGVRDVLQRILVRAGYQVRTATHAHDAQRQLREAAPAVVVTDMHMPGPSGVWLAQQVRQESPHTAVVLITTDREIPPSDTMRKGIVAYMIKPFDPSRVLAAVSEAYGWWARESGGEIPTLTPQKSAPSPAAPPFAAPSYAAPPPPAHVGYAPQPTYASYAPPHPHAAGHPVPPPRTVSLKLVIIGALIAAAIVAGLFYMMSRDRGRLLSRVAASSGMVLLYDGSGGTLSQGSGFFIAPDIFVTNHHVVAGGVAAKIVVGRDEYPVAGAIAADRGNDLVLLKTTRPNADYLRLSSVAPAIGDEISVYGAPRGLAGTLSTGIVSTSREDADAQLQLSAPVSPGSSGGPVVDGVGDVVGVVVSVSNVAQGVSFAIPATLVQALLDRTGDVRPIITTARGAGDDRERHELIGPVRLAATTGGAAPVELLFDRDGRLLEQRAAGDGTVRYQYDERGRLTSEVHLQGESAVETWEFTPLGPLAVEGTEKQSGRVKRVVYGDDRRLQSEEMRLGGVQLLARNWTYSADAWPSTGGLAADGEERDAIGNPARRKLVDGSVVSYQYRFDRRGNWIWREGLQQDAAGRPVSSVTETRTIHYWDEAEN